MHGSTCTCTCINCPLHNLCLDDYFLLVLKSFVLHNCFIHLRPQSNCATDWSEVPCPIVWPERPLSVPHLFHHCSLSDGFWLSCLPFFFQLRSIPSQCLVFHHWTFTNDWSHRSYPVIFVYDARWLYINLIIIIIFTLLFVCSLFLTGFKRPLQDSDLWSLEEKSLSCNFVPRLHREWNKELRKSLGWVHVLVCGSTSVTIFPLFCIHFSQGPSAGESTWLYFNYRTLHVSHLDLHILVPLIIDM